MLDIIKPTAQSSFSWEWLKHKVFSLSEHLIIELWFLLLVSCQILLRLFLLPCLLIKEAANCKEMPLIFAWCLPYKFIHDFKRFFIVLHHQATLQNVVVGLVNIQ